MAIAKTKWALPANIQATLTKLFVGNPDQIFVLFFDRLYKKYGRNTPHDTEANSERMRVAWDPMTRDIANVIRQIQDASLYAHFTSEIKPEHELITAGDAIVLNTGLFKKEYSNWRARQPDQRTSNNLEVFWTNTLDLWNDTTRTTSQSGFGGNAEGVQQDKAVEQTYVESVQQFANVNKHNASTFNNLTASNMQMLNNISPTLQALQ